MKTPTIKNTKKSKRRVDSKKTKKNDHQLNILYEDASRHHREAVMHNQDAVEKKDKNNIGNPETH